MPPKHLLQAMLGACKALQMHSDRRCKVLMYDMFGHPSRVTLVISSIWGISYDFPNILDAADAMEGVRNREIF